jgi:hypothetical protein
MARMQKQRITNLQVGFRQMHIQKEPTNAPIKLMARTHHST